MDKFALVYEFNKNSPLIVYKASKEIEDRNITKAIEMLNSAIDKYPYYPTAYYLLATALAYNDEFEEANTILSQAHNLLDNEQTYNFYINLLEKIKRENEGISIDFDDTINQILDESFPHSEEIDLLEVDKPIEKRVEENIKTKIKTHLPDGTIVTETLAEIYSSQGNYNEAIEIYKKLMDIHPNKIEKFEKKITELSNTLNNK